MLSRMFENKFSIKALNMYPQLRVRTPGRHTAIVPTIADCLLAVQNPPNLGIYLNLKTNIAWLNKLSKKNIEPCFDIMLVKSYIILAGFELPKLRNPATG